MLRLQLLVKFWINRFMSRLTVHRMLVVHHVYRLHVFIHVSLISTYCEDLLHDCLCMHASHPHPDRSSRTDLPSKDHTHQELENSFHNLELYDGGPKLNSDDKAQAAHHPKSHLDRWSALRTHFHAKPRPHRRQSRNKRIQNLIQEAPH